ncbi:MAG: RnfABCDGE type electron transport complex subunit B [Desulfobacterales bacterium]|nr:RnfABCDGE type electron transport complex subunit B [Desulfobacterales bacterium]
MIEAIGLMGGLGIIIGVVLAAASKVFYVYVDPLILDIDDALPGANCGGCGLPGCLSNAEAISKGEAAPNSCIAGDSDLAETIAGIMGVSVEAKEPDIALPDCTYGTDKADLKFIYKGLNDCRAAYLINGGMKVCNIGCLGLGSCKKACMFGAIEMSENGLPIIIEENCVGCGACERTCPKNIIHLSSVTRRIIQEYTTENCTTPCQRSCPAGINISSYIGKIADGEYEGAIQVIKERNPFPTVIGRICGRPCENSCRRQLVDEPIAINFLKRFASDYEKENGRVLPFKAPATDKMIAIVGGGVQGLSTAFFSARLGHSPTVFESTDKLGGLLRSAISKNRLPLNILDWDIDGILEMGVDVEYQKSLGSDFTVDSLLDEDYHSVFVASGGWDNKLLRGTSNKVESIIPGTYLLIDFHRNRQDIIVKNDVVITSNGQISEDLITALHDSGAKNITVVVRDKKEDYKGTEIDGVNFIYNASISNIKGKQNKLENVVIKSLNSEDKEISASTLLIASGRFPHLVFTRNEEEEQWTGSEVFKISENAGLLSKEDSLSDFSAAIKAIAEGRRGAAVIHQNMYDIEFFKNDLALTKNPDVQDVKELESVHPLPRQIMPLRVVTEDSVKEIEKGFTKEMATIEANRCLRCGLICYKKNKIHMKA